ncbi:MAG TPA: hypothetical protein K8U78_04275 [Aeriscardovia aeriphila]|uniref:Rod shape-determining protein RodA n=1 Tax=Aeriscardovia aeriphila TaxID=218139 RepID=A0A921KCI4_9BIFI|nr:hypothetical protein [Aeriscardovia aeriphila]
MSENLPAENIPTQRNEQSFDADEPRLDRDYQRSESFEQRPDSDEEKVVNASLAQLARGEKEGSLEKHLDSNNVDLEKNSLDESDNNDDDNAEQSTPVPEVEEKSFITGHKHPYVSEKHEGKPWFEWLVAALVVLSGVLAATGLTGAGIGLLSAVAGTSALIRLLARSHSPWKVRSVFFDCFIGFGLMLGIPFTYWTVLWILA